MTKWCLTLLAGVCVSAVHAEPYIEYEEPGTRNDYHSNPEIFSRRSDHFVFRFGPLNKQGILTEQLFQSCLQYMEHVNDTWIELGLSELGGKEPGVKYKTVIEPGQCWKGDHNGAAVGFGVGPDVPGLHIPANALLVSSPNGCLPHELGHGWDRQGNGLPSIEPAGYTEGLANWLMQLDLVEYPDDWPSTGYTFGHAVMYYNTSALFNHFLDAPGYGIEFLENLIHGENLNSHADMEADDIIRKAMRYDTTPAKNKAGKIHDELGRMNARMLNMDFWNHRDGMSYLASDDEKFEGFFFRRINMVAQPGVEEGWLRPEWTCVPQYLMSSYIPLEIEKGQMQVECDFLPVADPIRKAAFRACFVAFDKDYNPRYSNLWNAGKKTFSLAEDDVKLYLAIIASPEKSNDSVMHNDYTREHPALFPYRIKLTGATPIEWQHEKPKSGFSRHENGGGIVMDTAHVDKSAFVGRNAMVLGKAKVYGNARIEDFAVVRGDAVIGREGESDRPVVSGYALVEGQSRVYGNAKVREHAWLRKESEVFDSALVMAHSQLEGAKVSGRAVLNMTQLRDKGFNLRGEYAGYSIIGGDAIPQRSTGTEVVCEIGSKVDDCHYQYLGYDFEKNSAIFAMDEYGLNHSYLINGPYPVQAEINNVKTTALKLNGEDQYIELRPDAFDFADMTIAFWVYNESDQPEATILSLGDGKNKSMTLSSDLVFTAIKGRTVNKLTSTKPLQKGQWTHVAIIFSGDTVAMAVNGEKAGVNQKFTLNPDDLHAPLMHNANYIGRSNAGNFFKGMIDEFKVIRKVVDKNELAAFLAEIKSGDAPQMESTPPAASGWIEQTETFAQQDVGMPFVSLSAAKGEDENGILYYFACKSNPELDSGWISENKYIVPKPESGAVFAVKLKDRFGNVSEELAASSVIVESAAPSPAIIPEVTAVGIHETTILVKAQEFKTADSLIRYRFARGGSTVNSGWISRNSWTDENLTPGKSYTYEVDIRDGLGRTKSASSGKVIARDDTPPQFSDDFRMQWYMKPYTLLDRTVRLGAREASDAEYYFECLENPKINSGWIADRMWVSPALDYGKYSFHFKLRDRSPRKNETAWSVPKSAVVTPKNTFADYEFSQLNQLELDTLVRFRGKVTAVNKDHYLVSGSGSKKAIRVIPRTFNLETNPEYLGKTVNIEGHLWAFEGIGRIIDYAKVAQNPQWGRIEFEDGNIPEEKIFPIYDTRASKSEYLGWYREGWYVEIENVAACKEMYIGYAGSGILNLYVNGEFHKEIMLPNKGDNENFYTTKADGLNIPRGATLKFDGPGNPRLDYIEIGVEYHTVSGKVLTESGRPLEKAPIFFSTQSPAMDSPEAMTKTDRDGNYSKLLKAGRWHVAAAAPTIDHMPSKEQQVTVGRGDVSGIDFELAPNKPRMDFPQQDKLLFACLAEMLLVDTRIPDWKAYAPEEVKLDAWWGSAPRYNFSHGFNWVVIDYDSADGFVMPPQELDIPTDGATIIARVMPTRNEDHGNWRCIVDVFFGRLILGIHNDSGELLVKRNGEGRDFPEVVIPADKPSILSLVVQRDGTYKVYMNGKEVASEDSKSDMSRFECKAGGLGIANLISIGRGFDGWSTFSGKVGDVCVYKAALSDAERSKVEKQFATPQR